MNQSTGVAGLLTMLKAEPCLAKRLLCRVAWSAIPELIQVPL